MTIPHPIYDLTATTMGPRGQNSSGTVGDWSLIKNGGLGPLTTENPLQIMLDSGSTSSRIPTLNHSISTSSPRRLGRVWPSWGSSIVNVNANTQNEEDGPGTPDSLVVFLMTMLTMAQLDDPSPKMDAMSWPWYASVVALIAIPIISP